MSDKSQPLAQSSKMAIMIRQGSTHVGTLAGDPFILAIECGLPFALAAYGAVNGAYPLLIVVAAVMALSLGGALLRFRHVSRVANANLASWADDVKNSGIMNELSARFRPVALNILLITCAMCSIAAGLLCLLLKTHRIDTTGFIAVALVVCASFMRRILNLGRVILEVTVISVERCLLRH